MPAQSRLQKAFAGAELSRKRAGQATKTGMSEGDLADFARGSAKGLPKKAPKRGKRR